MKLLTTLCFLIAMSTYSQNVYESSEAYPFGQPHPDAPEQIKDFHPLIGECQCKSESRNPDQSWAEPIDMIWRWKYIMNGMAVQDETLKNDGKHSGSIRQFIADSSRWYVHYYSSAAPSTTLGTWEGNREDNGNIVLYRDQKAPNGMDGYSRLTFYDIDETGYKWIGEWIDQSNTVSFPFWKISCTREKNED